MGLQGFGNNNSGSFTPGDAIYAKQLNRLADYADRAAVGVSDGVIYQSHAGGLALSSPPIDSTRNILPFTVSVVLEGSNWKYRVFPGTLNNVIPKMGSPSVPLTNNPAPTATFGKSEAENQLEYIYIASSPASEDPYFPDPNNCKIINDSSPQTDDDSNSYLLIATVNQKTGAVTQMVNSSLWGSRFKCGAEQATYWYSRV